MMMTMMLMIVSIGVAIGGCGSASAARVGDECSTSGTRGFPPKLCGDELECVIFDEGQPAVDIPNRGLCQLKPVGRLLLTEIASPLNIFGSASFLEVSNVGDADVRLREYSLVKVEKRRGDERVLRVPLVDDDTDDNLIVRVGESFIICESKASFDVAFNGTAACMIEAGRAANVVGDDIVMLTIHAATPSSASDPEVRASSVRAPSDDPIEGGGARPSQLELVVDVYGGNIFMRPAHDGGSNLPTTIPFLRWQTVWPPMLYGRAVRVRRPPPPPSQYLSTNSLFNLGALVAFFNADEWRICSLLSDGGNVIDVDNDGASDFARFMTVCPMRALVAPNDYDPKEWSYGV